MTGKPLQMKRPLSPSKRGQMKPSQQALTFRQVNNILESCRTNFNNDFKNKKQMPSPNSDRTLRAKALNGKAIESKVNGKVTSSGSLRKDGVVRKNESDSNKDMNMAQIQEFLRNYEASPNSMANKDNSDRQSKSEMASPKSGTKLKRSSKANSAPASPTKPQSNGNVKRKSSSTNFDCSIASEKQPNVKRAKTEELKSEQGDEKRETITKPNKRKATPMDEVMKLHQDEGVMHLLHALPTSRRKVQTTLYNAGGMHTATSSGRRLSTDSEEKVQQSTKESKKETKPTRNYLVRANLSRVKEVAPEELMDPKTLELLKGLSKKDYLRLWSSKSRYKLTEEAMDVSRQSEKTSLLKESSVSPDSSAGSDISSASALAAKLKASKRVGSRMLTNVTNIPSKGYKDILLRSYPTFVSIIMSPSTTGIRQSFNVNVIEEILDALDTLKNLDQCSAVLITGLGHVFSQGIDLTALTHDSFEKQRRTAEALAKSIRKLVQTFISYPKLLVAGVNGKCSGLGVMLLPYFDLVYVNDKAVFNVNYCRLGQIPEAFPSASLDSRILNEMCFLGRSLSAEELVNYGLANASLWPDRFLEELVPRLERLEEMSIYGIKVTKSVLRENQKQKLANVMENESKKLVDCWTRPEFPKKLKNYLKGAQDIIFQ